VQELPALAAIAAGFREHAVAVAVVNQKEPADRIRPVYEKDAPGLPVVCDEDGRISRAFGVDVTPYCFLLDAEGRIVKRRSFTSSAATASLNQFLGLALETPRYKPSEAG